MNGLSTIERRVDGEIMNTDVLIRISAAGVSKLEMEVALDQAFRLMREFADRFSRFSQNNELWYFNESEGGAVTEELFDLLSHAEKHFQESGRLIDPSILPILESEGYHGAYRGNIPIDGSGLLGLVLDRATRSAQKPRDLKLDFGGFGKGYIVDRIANRLAERYPHVLVDAGGDIATRGSDVGRGESGWIIAVEQPTTRELSGILLRISNEAVATSGKNRRTWKSDGAERHHLIDPLTRKPSTSDLLSVTVIAPDCENADVTAKTLFLLGKDRAIEKAETEAIPMISFDESGHVTINSHMEPYVVTS